jgi:hypothetical protein
VVRIWDIVSGRLLSAIRNHQKDITCLTMNGAKDRLLSGGMTTLKAS